MISRQLVSQSVARGASAAFFVATTNPPVLRYQWTRDGLKLARETNRSLAIVAARLADAGDYAVIVSNSAGTVTSVVAWMGVSVLLTITTQPQASDFG